MANPALHHNGTSCPQCELRREAVNLEFTGAADVPCNGCGGTGRIAHSDTTIVRDCVEWAREHYWPEREARWALQNQGVDL